MQPFSPHFHVLLELFLNSFQAKYGQEEHHTNRSSKQEKYYEENKDGKEEGKMGGREREAGRGRGDSCGKGMGGGGLAGFVWCKSGIVTKTRDPLVRLVPDSLKEHSIN